MSSRVNADILLEIIVHLEGADRISIAHSCRLGFELSGSPSYWGRTIPAAHFGRIAQWSDYTGEEYRVAALRTKRVRDTWESVSIDTPESPTLSTSTDAISTSLVAPLRHHSRIPTGNRRFQYIEGTQWLLDTSQLSKGKYSFIDLKSNRECTTTLERRFYERGYGFNGLRFSVISPMEILLMCTVLVTSSVMSSCSYGAELLRFWFTEDQDHSISVTCTLLWAHAPEVDILFDCNQQFAATYAWQIEPYRYNEDRAIITLYEIGTGKKYIFGLKRSLGRLFILGGYLLLFLKYQKEPELEIIVESLSSLASRAVNDNVETDPSTARVMSSDVMQSNLDHSNFPEISNSTNTFKLYIKDEQRSSLKYWDVHISEIESGGAGRFRVVIQDKHMFLLEVREQAIYDKFDNAKDFTNGKIAIAASRSSNSPDDPLGSSGKIVHPTMNLHKVIPGFYGSSNSPVTMVPTPTDLRFAKMGRGIIVRYRDTFNLKELQILDLSKRHIRWIPQISHMLEDRNKERHAADTDAERDERPNSSKGEGDAVLFRSPVNMALEASSQPSHVDMNVGLIMLSAPGKAYGDGKESVLDVLWM